MILVVLLALLIPSLADAACSGSGVTWTCPAGSTIADVETAMASATDGATITFASGAYTWTVGTIDLLDAKGVTLICEVTWACDVSVNLAVMALLEYSGTNTKTYRISGFDFDMTGGGCSNGSCLQVYKATSGAGTDSVSNFRLDHNRITELPAAQVFMQIGATDRGGKVFGVADHNTLVATTAHIFIHQLGPGDIQAGYAWGTSDRGSANNFYIEDNTLTFSQADANLRHCMDLWRSGAMVYRYNTSTNCRVATHGVIHGGVRNWEVYRNQIERTASSGGVWEDCTRCIHSQGSGEIYIWDNRLLGAGGTVNSAAITVQHYRSDSDNPGTLLQCDGTRGVDGNTSTTATHRGWPCIAQPGRMDVGGTPTWGKLAPVAVFKNYNGGDNTIRNVTISSGAGGAPDYIANHMVADRDYLNAVSVTAQTTSSSPFDGTTGIGHGTLANRPTTCTHTTAPDGDEGGGVMYWATDQGSWNVSGDGRGSGVLYRCSATNTWTVHYTPYTYPHPLQGASFSVEGSGSGLKGGKGLGLY